MRLFLIILALFTFWSCTSSDSTPLSDTTYNGPKETRTLYLIRHSKSDHSDSSVVDFDRHISKKGKADALLIGEKLMQKGIVLDAIISSPAKRTRSTAKRIAAGLNFEKDSILLDSTLYECKTRILIGAIRGLKEHQKSVVIIGHNPSLIQAANHFQKDTIFTAVPTTGTIAIEFESNSWKELGNKDGKFLFFEYPKKYKHENLD